MRERDKRTLIRDGSTDRQSDAQTDRRTHKQRDEKAGKRSSRACIRNVLEIENLNRLNQLQACAASVLMCTYQSPHCSPSFTEFPFSSEPSLLSNLRAVGNFSKLPFIKCIRQIFIDDLNCFSPIFFFLLRENFISL